MARARDNQTRLPVTLACTLCGTRNYKTTRSREMEGQLTLKKHCPQCGIHTVHIESK